jgi:hypothetical protein
MRVNYDILSPDYPRRFPKKLDWDMIEEWIGGDFMITMGGLNHFKVKHI